MLLDSVFPWLPLFPEFFIPKPIEQDMQMMDDLHMTMALLGSRECQAQASVLCHHQLLGLPRRASERPLSSLSALPPSNPL